ncbi:MAG: carbohydrate ABC transporter permease [Sphaerochaeta sp.]|uniref:carbohydrate ABC transporter permease n=1 Tax=Sphaerochaeta sp. TaxID=1972642 RepID=UPI003D0F285B
MAKKQSRVGILLYAPAIILILAIVIYPMIYALQMSVTNYRPTLAKVSIVGMKNYVILLEDIKFWQSLGRSLVFTFGSLIPQIVLGLAMASLLNNPLLKWKMLFRGLAITPWLIPTVAVAMIFRWMFHDLYGIINYLLVDLGFIDSPKAWIAQQGSAMFLLVLANIWRGTPLMITMFLAGLQGIPLELYESAQVDGANAWFQFRKITLPLLMPVVMVSGILRFIWTFNFYDLPWVMTGGGPSESTQTTPIYAFRKAFSSYRMGEGSAITIVLFIILVIFSISYFKIKKYQDKIYN